MEKILKLYTYIDGINDTPFPSEEYQVVTSNFRSDYKRMGGAPSITCTIMHPMCLDKLWTYGVYAKFNGERFFIKQIPSSSYDNTDARYKHELELVSERIILDNVYVYDVVDSASVDDKPVSNSSKFTFFGTINEFVQRLNQSLRYSGLDYTIVVDKGITSEGKLVAFENQFFSNALQEIYNIFELPYYFVGKVIHVGYTSNAITRTFKYGNDESLLSIQKQNANYKIVNRATGLGSADNIPYYYPNDDEKGETALYYNGELGIATISNPTRFKKVALGDIFKYTKGGSVNERIFETNDYTLGFVDVTRYIDELGNVVDGVNKWSIEFKYKFSTTVTRDFSFYINCQYLETIEVRAHISRDNGGFSKTWTNPNLIEQAFNQGDYTLTISWDLKSSQDSTNDNDTIAREFINKNYTVQGSTLYENYDGWLLNNTRVLLTSYGININTSPNGGDMITFERLSYIQPQSNLMPPIYRESAGKDRFYNALNNTYISPQTNDFYEFENPYVEGQPKEHIVTFDSIKPSIVGIRNAENQRIDTFLEFAYDANDNDETYPEGHAKAGEYIHPYFFAKLRRFNGQFGFNLFDHSIDESEMVISMTSGSCGACEFIIGVTDDTQENIVQVDERGNLLRDKDGNVIRSGAPQERQNNTIDNEVWIALKKDINTFGVIMPNASNKYRPSEDDTFVILHIDLPKAYILAAEERLKEEIIKYMALNNSEKFNFSISFSRIFFAENPDILAQLDENARIQIEYDGERYELYVSSYSYNMTSEQPLPEIKVELSDTITVTQNALQNAISEVKRDIMSSVGSIDFLAQGLGYFLRKDVDDRARGKIASDVGFEVGKFVSGASGASIYKDAENGQTIAEFDKLYIRMKAYFETLEIVNANTIGGKQVVSPAGSIKCVGVDDRDDVYRCYFLAEQDGEKITNRWVKGDQAYSQIFNAQSGVYNNVSNTYYWRLVTNVSKEVEDFDGKKCHYIDLSKSDCDKGSDIPNIGDVINQRGSRTELDRMNFIEWSSVDSYSPNVTLFHGVNSYSLDEKAYVSFGVDKTTNKAFMNVYGEMYVGDRQGGSYMRYTQENGLEISGTLSVGTKLGDTPLKDLISASSPEGYQEFVEKVTQDIEGLQQQLDGSIDSYFYQYDPTNDNYPAMEWDTNEKKGKHLNDTFTNVVSGRSWRWVLFEGEYKWVEISETATTQALALAAKAQDTADGKRTVFVDTPKPPYQLGDLWSRGSNFPLLICGKAKNENESYSESDWVYADNSEKIKSEMQSLVNTTKDDLNNAIGRATEAANEYADQGINAAQSALQKSIDELNNAKANANDVYTRAEADGVINKSEQDAINAAKEQADAAIALSEITIKAYADGVVDAEEAARIKQAQENLDAAKQYAEQKAREALDESLNQLGTFDYLKAALKEAPTTIQQGLVQTSLIQLGYTSNNQFVPMSGTNGIYNASSHGGGVASWWGGELHDLLDYYDWNGNDWVVKSGKTPPTSMPSGLIRFDGTGYLAKGKFWWDRNGKIYADPTALFLMFDVEDEAQSLSSTILAILDKQTEFEDMWSVKTDKNGTKYLYSKYHLVSQHGITMYGDATALNIPSIYDGLPIDGSSIYWENGVLKARGGGSFSGTITFKDIDNVGNWADSVAPQDRIMYQPANSSQWVAKNLSDLAVGGVSGDYLPLSGGRMQGSIDVADYNILSGGNPIFAIFNNGKDLYTSSTNLYLQNNVYYFDGSSTHAILHSGNYSSYALPLTGGTLTGHLGINVSIANSGISLSYNGTAMGSLTTNGSTFEMFNTYGYGITTLGTSLYALAGWSRYTLWHSGNDGSGSGLDADLLDGYHVDSLFKGVYDANIDFNSFADDSNANNFYYVHESLNQSNRPILYGGLLQLGSSTMNAQIAFDYQNKAFLRTRWWSSNGYNWAGWREFAFTDSNVASATKLQTARTIWGQSFDGTGDIGGNCIVTGTLTTNQSWSDGASIHIKENRNDGAGGYQAIRFYYNNDNQAVIHYFYNNYNGFAWTKKNLNLGAQYITLGDWGNPVMLVDNVTRNVGIGMTNPVNKLDVNGKMAAYGIMSNGYDMVGAYPHITLHIPGVNYQQFFMRGDGVVELRYGDSSQTGARGTLAVGEFYSSSNGWFDGNLILGGSVGIGTTNPSYKLDVNGGAFINGELVSKGGVFGGNGGSIPANYWWGLYQWDGKIQLSRRTTSNGYESDYFYIDVASKNIVFSAGITMYSDQRKKTIINNVELSLKDIANAPLIKHYYNSDDKKTTHVGSIAQYWASMNDWFCKLDSEGYYTMEIQNCALASAISIARELDRYETKTDKTIKQLRKRICQLEEEVERLKSA